MASSPRASSRARESLFPEQVIYLGAHPVQGSRFAPVPEAEAVDRWRERAESQREECLARFDLALVSGKDPNLAAREILAGFLTWTRWSARAFAKSPDDGLACLLRAQEQAAWDLLADTAAARAARDTSAVDRFLDVWLTVVHEAIRTGNAPLYAASV
jgi:hypothetical protein